MSDNLIVIQVIIPACRKIFFDLLSSILKVHFKLYARNIHVLKQKLIDTVGDKSLLPVKRRVIGGAWADNYALKNMAESFLKTFI